MLTTNDLHAIKTIVKEETDPLKQDVQGLKKQLDTVEMKVEAVNNRVGKLEGEVNQIESNLIRVIKESQEDTIISLTELINTSYNMHEERIKKIEETLHISHSQ